MLYLILKVLVNIYYRAFYKLSYRGLNNIPRDKPIILAPNHVNGFVDPVVIAMLLNRKVRFFARGDVFKKKFAKWILNKLNISPMYRIQEGYSELKKNDKTFEECRSLLSQNKTLLMFPEAICVQEKRLRPLKKGLARIVFQTEESFQFNKDVLVIPIGLNYSNAKSFRSKLFIDFGKPLSTKEYEGYYTSDKVKAINDYTKTLEQKMSEHLLIINNKENDDLVIGIEEMFLHQYIKAIQANVSSSEKEYLASCEIANSINNLENTNPEIVISLRKDVMEYITLIHSNGLRDHLLRPEVIEKMNIGTFILECFIIYLGMPIYIIGLIFNYLPFFIAKNIAKTKSKNVEFFASLHLNLAMILHLLYFFLQLLIVEIIFHSWLFLAFYACLIISTSWFAIKFYSIKQKIFARWRLLKMVSKERSKVEEIMGKRALIVDTFENIRVLS